MGLLPSLFSGLVVSHQIPFGNLNNNWDKKAYDRISIPHIHILGLEDCEVTDGLQNKHIKNKNKELKTV